MCWLTPKCAQRLLANPPARNKPAHLVPAMPPLLLSSDFDPFQVAIIVIAVLASFVKWLWENWQQKQGAVPAPTPDPEEQLLREAAWRKQTGQDASPPPIPPVAAPSAWDELRKAWKELQETARSAQAPARPTQPQTPPPLPQRQQVPRTQGQPRRQPQPQRQEQPYGRPHTPRQPVRTPAPLPTSTATANPALAAVAAPAIAQPKSPAPVGSVLATLRSLRRDPAMMRQAILMHEILGPPKALQSSTDFAI